MSRKTVSAIMMFLLVLGTLALAFNVQPVRASGTIYVRADGSIDPPMAPIYTLDNITYFFVDNIHDSIVVERDNIVLDGAGYTLQGADAYNSTGIDLSERTNVTVQNVQIQNFIFGILLDLSSNSRVFGNKVTDTNCGIEVGYSSSNIISGNNATANRQYGIRLDSSSSNSILGNNATDNQDTGINVVSSSSNIIFGNTVVNNGFFGIYLTEEGTGNNTVSGNNVANNYCGITLDIYSSNNSVNGNNVTNNDYGIYVVSSSDNSIAENNVVNNRAGIYLYSSSNNSVNENNIANNEAGGIYLIYSSSNNSINGDNITANNGDGIFLDYSSNNNSINGNNITANNVYGIELDSSSNNGLSGNNIANNGVGGIYLYSSYDNSLSGNNVTANNGIGIRLSSSSSNNVSGNNIKANNYDGIWLYSSSNNNVSGNSIANNGRGIGFYSSSGNSLSGNDVTANNGDGIYLYISFGNSIYHNNFIGNAQQVSSDGLANVWDDDYPSGGNYWSDYNGTDTSNGPYQNVTGSDGMGDTPYVINVLNVDHYPLMKPYPWAAQDIGITNVAASKNFVGQGYNVSVNVLVFNYGNDTEDVNITVYANQTVIGGIFNVELTSRNFAIVPFTWNTTGFAKGNYTLWAYAEPAPGETSTTDNNCTCGTITVSIVGDVNGDGKVNLIDVFAVSLAYGSYPSHPTWNPNYDINNDGKINLIDYFVTALNYGKTDP